MVAPRCCPEAFSASATMMEASEDIVLLDPSFRAGAGAGSMRRETTKNEKTVEPISLRLLRWRQDWGGDWDWEQFLGGVKGDGGGDDEVDFDNFGNPHLLNHWNFLTLTAAVTRIIISGATITTPNAQPHQPGLLRRCIAITAPPIIQPQQLPRPTTFIFKVLNRYHHFLKGVR